MSEKTARSAAQFTTEELDRHFHNMPDAFFLMKILLNDKGEAFDWHYVYANQAALANVGMKREEFIGKSFFEVFGDTGDGKWLEPYYEAAYQGKSTVLEEYSQEVHRFVQVTCFQYEYGYAACFVRDITQNYLYERTLQSTTLSYREIYFIDLVEDYYQIVYPEVKEEEERGVYSHAVDRHFRSGMIHAEDEEEVRDFLSTETVRKKLEHQDSVEYKYRRRRPETDAQGESEWCLVSFTVGERQNGHPLTAIMTIRSIDALVREEQKGQKKLKKALKEVEEANAAKGQFLAQMSHDIRTPLNAILGLTELAAGEEDPETIHRHLESIRSSGKFLLSLINDILDVSKTDSTRLVLEESPCLLEDFEADILAAVQPLMEQKNISFKMEMNCGLTCVVTDGRRMLQLFQNLLSNAAKYTPKGGHVRFLAELLREEKNTHWVRFTVEDDGIGMSEEFLQHAFDPFTRENSIADDQWQGTGLGLTICRRIVDAAGGEIRVQSRKGEGTVFFVDLPLTPAKDVNSENKRQIPFDHELLKGKKILLAEDNQINRAIARALLERKGMIVTEAVNGKDCVEQWKASGPFAFDAILMDIRMPEMDGLTAAKTIRAEKRADAGKIPIVAMTANAYASDMNKSVKAGMNGHLTKPVETEALYDMLCRVTEIMTEF